MSSGTHPTPHRLLRIALSRIARRIAAGLLGAAALAPGPLAAAPIDVTTAQYDNARSGWDPHERTLTPAAVAGGGFALLRTVPLPGLPSGQPLVMRHVAIAGDPAPGTHDVVYVATRRDTVVAIDPTRGSVLLQRNLGSPAQNLCFGTGANEGGRSTPVIDPVTRTLYVMVQVQEAAGIAFRLHALDLATLADKVPPALVAATQTLTDGTSIAFDASTERQMPALLLSHGAIYAAFSMNCETDKSSRSGDGRGWLLGWSADTLRPLRSRDHGRFGLLTDHDALAPDNFFGTSIWMSGAGLAADERSIYFVTGNSDPSGLTYDGVANIPESAVRVSASTGRVESLFTPATVAQLDKTDADFGAGGMTLLPETGMPGPRLAVAAGKSGIMYLMDRDNLGGFTPGGPDNVLAQVGIGGCWCVASTFVGGGATWVVSSGGDQLMLWQLTGGARPGLTLAASSQPLPYYKQYGAMFSATVSSADREEPVIWTVVRSVPPDRTLQLLAFAGRPAPGSTALPPLFAAPAVTWSSGGIADVTPVVANGYVYLAGDSLAIFGLPDAPAGSAGR